MLMVSDPALLPTLEAGGGRGPSIRIQSECCGRVLCSASAQTPPAPMLAPEHSGSGSGLALSDCMLAVRVTPRLGTTEISVTAGPGPGSQLARPGADIVIIVTLGCDI